MAEYKFTLIPDLKKFKKELKELFDKRYSVNLDAKTSGATGGATKSVTQGSGDSKTSKEIEKQTSTEAKSSKKTSGLLGGIMKALAPLTVLLAMKPITDLLSMIVNFAMLGFMQIGKLLGSLAMKMEQLRLQFVEKIKGMWESFKELVPQIWTKVGEWLGLVIDWIKELPTTLWTLLKEGFTWLVTGLVNLGTMIAEWISGIAVAVWGYLQEGFKWIVEKVLALWESVKGLAAKIWNFFSDKVESIVTFIKNIWNGITGLAGAIWDKIKEGFQWIKDGVANLWQGIKDLPQLIWDKIQKLASLIGTAIKNALPKFGFGGGTTINDGIVKPDGTVIKTHPQDTIIATKTPGNLGGGGSNVVNMYGVTSEQMMREVKRMLAKDVNNVSRF